MDAHLPVFEDAWAATRPRPAGGRHRWLDEPRTEEIELASQPPITTGMRRPRAASTSYNARDVAKAYNAPLGQYDGTGLTVGIVELGGGYNAGDMSKAGLTSSKVTAVPVAGGKSKSDGPDGADGEVMLDVEVVAGVAPGAAIRVYFCPNTDAGFTAAIAQAGAECDVVSVSWGGPESQWSASSIKKMSAVIAALRAKGVPVMVAAGDTGSKDSTGSDVVDYPACDPNAVGCGGTKLTLSGGGRASEVTWDEDDTRSATGGGVSKIFPGRQVPDVAGNADPATGYNVVVDGAAYVIGGTSAVAPLYAACYVLALQAYGKPFDLVNTLLTNPTVCYDVTVGDNGGYRAGPGRDDVTGFGVVDWGKLIAILTSGTQVPAPGGTTTTGGGTGDQATATDALRQIEAIAAQALGA
jgi:kumamolisin